MDEAREIRDRELEEQIRLGKPCPVCGLPVTAYKAKVAHTK